MKRPWTPRDLRLLTDLEARKASMAEMMEALDRSQSAIEHKRYRRRTASYEALLEKSGEAIRADWKNPRLTTREIAERHGVTTWIIQRAVQDMGLERRKAGGSKPKPKPPPQKISLWPEGMRFEDHPRCNDPRYDYGLRGPQPKRAPSMSGYPRAISYEPV